MSYSANSNPTTTYYNPFSNTISYPTKQDPSIVYHNTFENTIFNQSSRAPANMSSNTNQNDPEIYQRFTATGRPISTSAQTNPNSFFSGWAGAESFGAAAPNLLPVRFTDASIISVPVLPHAEPSQAKPEDSDSDTNSNLNPTKEPKSRSSRFSISSFRRKSSSGDTKKEKKKKDQDFVIKQMTRENYLKHYAKDDNGKFIGSEEPAFDCILNNDEDRVKWRRA